MKPTIISISGYAQHGKDTTASILEKKLKDHNKKCFRINYGDLLKYIAKQYYGWDGKKNIFGRTLLQYLGTELIRSNDPNFWVDFVIRLMDNIGGLYDYVLISDSRFENEIIRWVEEEYPILTIHVKRLNFDNGLTEEQKSHKSETSLDHFVFNYYLQAETLDDLEKEIEDKLGFLYKG